MQTRLVHQQGSLQGQVCSDFHQIIIFYICRVGGPLPLASGASLQDKEFYEIKPWGATSQSKCTLLMSVANAEAVITELIIRRDESGLVWFTTSAKQFPEV